MRGYLKYELKKIWQGKVFWFVLIASAVIAILGFFLACYNNAPMGDCGTTLETIYSAEKYTLLRGAGDIATLTMLCVVPIFAVILAGTSYGQEKKSHLVPVLVCRGERSAYLCAKGIAVAITGFISSILPFLFSGFFAVLAVPVKEVEPILTISLYEESSTALYAREAGHMLFPSLYLNAPMLDYLAHVLLIGLYGMGLGLLAYGISFFFHKNQIVLLLLPMILSFTGLLLLSALGLSDYAVTSFFFTRPDASFSLNIFWALGILLGFILLDCLLIFAGTRKDRDVL